MSLKSLILLCCILTILIHTALAANSVSPPVQFGKVTVRTRKLASLPNGNGNNKIVCMIPHQGALYVCSEKSIFKVTMSGDVSLWFDVSKAVRSATGRNINTFQPAHGGVRSIAFHPNFNKNGKFYISAMEDRPSNKNGFTYISDNSKIQADGVLIEFEARNGVPIPDSYRNVFRVGMPDYDHPIKQIAFYGNLLYIAHGDGSVQNTTPGSGQNPDALGKILRINPLQTSSRPYSIPSDNPFAGSSSNIPDEVYALGFRNPHHICFGIDGTLYAAETGRSNVEEVNLVKKGGNYGWSRREGTFVHKGGGLISGAGPLPNNDASFRYEYPNAQVGHYGKVGQGFVGQAIAGGCPIENRSPLSGLYFYTDFPVSGKLFYSFVLELKSAVTRGNPDKLTQARTWQAKVLYDHDNNGSTQDKRFDNLGDVIKFELGRGKDSRVNIRIGRGPSGEMLWSSKTNGGIYLVTNSMPTRG